MSWLTLAVYSLNPQSWQPWLMSRPYYEGKRRKGGERRSKGMMTQGWLSLGDAVQVFRMRVNHVLLLASMSKRGWSQSASCRLCENRVEDVDHVLFDCPALEDCRSLGWGCQDRSQVLWAERSVLVEAAKLVRVFLRRTSNNVTRCARAVRLVRSAETQPLARRFVRTRRATLSDNGLGCSLHSTEDTLRVDATF